ncbi:MULTISPECIES: hypothetical protein [unclassified Tardiphaga]|uniref:hypothetical protein n=1 Tax=unclassified Tardiphaga TaxID=2631404 RepID=UPI00143E0506|nr:MULTISPECIES: hypothetical protein [unclassified Tardiphaga]MBC7584233.1 hypothetical protein [Tardiphaga sp.]
MDSYLGLIELIAVVAMFAAAWAVLEWQGRRLDRKKAEREASTTRPRDSGDP